MADTNKLGRRVAKYREQLGLTQEQLAERAGLELAYLQNVEDGKIYPPVGKIMKLSRALGQRLGTFMDDQFQPDPIVTRRDQRIEESSTDGDDGHYMYFPLGKGKTDRHMDPIYIRIGVDEVQKMSSHEGEEFIIVAKGKVIVKYGKEETILEKGDSAYYNSVVPHYIGAVDGPAEIVAVLYNPM